MTISDSPDPAVPHTTIEDLDAAICRLSRDINVAQYRLLLLIREFDDRFGSAKWSFRNCSEWFAWRSGITLSAAREKVRTAQALRGLPQISQAFADGRLSYWKVRALTWAADRHNEDLLLAYVLKATATQIEERCRQMRNVRAEATEHSRQSWARRTLSCWRNAERGTLTINLEVPLEAGEMVTRAIDRAIEAGEATSGPEFEEASWQTQQADALVAVARAYLDGPTTDDAPATSTADHYQVVVHVDEAALRGGDGRSDLPIETVKRLACDGSLVPVIEGAAGEPLNIGRKRRTVPPAIGCSQGEQLSSWQRQLPDGRCGRATAAARSPAVTRPASSTPITCTTGARAARPASTTWCCCAAIITGWFTRGAMAFTAMPRMRSTFSGRMGG